MIELLVVRACVVLTLAAAAWFLRPLQLDSPVAALSGAALGVAGVLVELRLKHVPLSRLIGSGTGALVAIICALLVSYVLGQAGGNTETIRFLQISIVVIAAYVGIVAGGRKGESLNLTALTSGAAADPKHSRAQFNLLDTSVIIDGRIADIAETGFLDGTLAIPQFVLRELQLVADSADSLKRNRGRRGLDILQRLQKMQQLKVQIMEDDFPHIRDVDMKLVELGKTYGCKIVTNDFNLNKVAQLHGVDVLNINELANALKPVVLPGESMRVFVLKEGKEYNQGVAYLDDGTMVVVDNARRLISKTIDISVTSVLQTTAGKMIFGRFDERTHAVYDKPQAGDRQHDRHPREQTNATAPQ